MSENYFKFDELRKVPDNQDCQSKKCRTETLALKSELNVMHHLHKNSPCATLIVNNSGDILDINPKAEKILSENNEELIDSNIFDLKLFNNNGHTIDLENILTSGDPFRFRLTQYIDCQLCSLKEGDIDAELIAIYLIDSVKEKNDKFQTSGATSEYIHRKKSEETLSSTNANLEAILESTADIIAARNLNGDITHYNKSFERLVKSLFGIEMKPGLNTLHYLSEEKRIYWENVLKFVVRNRERHHEIFIEEIDNDTRYYELVFNPIVVNDQVIGVAEFTRDITEFKKTEEDLRASQAELLTAQEIAQLGIYEWDLRDDSLTWSKHMYRMAGLDPDNFKGNLKETIQQVLHPDDRDRINKEIQEMIEEKETKNMEFRIIRQDGEERVWRSESEFILDENNNPIKCIGVHLDVTECNKAERALRSNLQFLETMLDTIPNPIFYKDRKGTYLGCNKAFSNQIFGLPKEQIAGKTLKDFPGHIPPDLVDVYAQKDKELIDNPGTQFYESKVKCADGTARDFLFNKATFYDANGRAKGLIGVMLDLTEQKKLEQQLLQSQKMEAIGILAGGIAHDFNNLLTAILGNSELMLKMVSEDNAIYEEINEIKNAANRAAALTNQLLAFSRRQALQKKNVNINDIVKNVSKMLHRLLGEDIDLISELAPDLKKVYVDSSQIEQVIINLAINARDAMPEGGTLFIQTDNVTLTEEDCKKMNFSSAGEYVRLAIQDSGEGIESDMLNQIFDPFFTTKGLRGTGLGLSVVYGIIKQHNGLINVDSEKEKGTRFISYLPVNTENPENSHHKTSQATVHEGNNEQVLVVEDDERVRNFIIKVLRKNNYKVFYAESAAEATKIFTSENREFILVFSDVVLPDRNGINLIEDFLSKKPDLKVILSSGYSDRKSQFHEIKEKGYAFLQKPFDIKDLLNTIQNVLS
ncbi:PAS domain S-box protein [candidate division KSB1 bacterium]|nr:PAS domain S-box protein [candidate division KSB1 bacterium]